MASLLRTAFTAALCALILLPLWAGNETVDRLFRTGAPPHATLDLQPAVPGHINGEVMARLYGLRAEIRADICSRGKQNYCVAGFCWAPAMDCTGQCTAGNCREVRR